MADDDTSKFVSYGGIATVRTISKQAWKDAGADGMADTRWDASNGKKVAVDKFSKEALELLRADGEFDVPKDAEGNNDSDNSSDEDKDEDNSGPAPAPSPRSRKS